jgi:hypothetical protein
MVVNFLLMLLYFFTLFDSTCLEIQSARCYIVEYETLMWLCTLLHVISENGVREVPKVLKGNFIFFLTCHFLCCF